MALITCPECGRSISNVADKCPHCGLPQSYFKTQSKATESNAQHQNGAQSSMQYQQIPQQQQYQPQQQTPQYPQFQMQQQQSQSQQSMSYYDNSTGGRVVNVAKPNNYLALAILAMVIGGLFGVASLVYSLKVDNLYFHGNYTEAISASKNAMIWAFVGISIGVLSVVFTILTVALS